MRNVKRSTSLHTVRPVTAICRDSSLHTVRPVTAICRDSSISSFHFKNENSIVPLPNSVNEDNSSVNEDNSSETEYIPPRPSRDIKELLEGPVSPPLLIDDNAHKNCPDDSSCILVIDSPFSNEFTQFKCAHCKEMGNFLSPLTFANKLLPPYQCILCKSYIHNECLILKCCIIF